MHPQSGLYAQYRPTATPSCWVGLNRVPKTEGAWNDEPTPWRAAMKASRVNGPRSLFIVSRKSQSDPQLLRAMVSALASYAVGRHFARPLLYRIAGEDRFRRAERLIHRGGAVALIGLRLIPIMPFSLMGYVCGAARIPLVRFTWTTAVGYAPLTAYFTYLGSRLESFSAEDPILWIGGAALLLCMLGIRYLLPRRGHEREEPKPERSPEPEQG